MERIEAALTEKYQPPSHCRIEDFLEVYLVQPWLAEQVYDKVSTRTILKLTHIYHLNQSVEDVRMEESADAKELKLGKIQEELHALKYKLQDMEDQMQALRKAIDKKESEIAGAVLMEGIEVEMDTAEQPTKSVADLTKVSKTKTCRLFISSSLPAFSTYLPFTC